MSLPGFIEYLFYGYEQRGSETGFFNPENFESSSQMNAGSSDQRMADDPSETNNDESYTHEILGYDAVTGKEFARERKRKPMRYYVPGLIGGAKNRASIQ